MSSREMWFGESIYGDSLKDSEDCSYIFWFFGMRFFKYSRRNRLKSTTKMF